MTASSRFQILALDGGGFKGIFSAALVDFYLDEGPRLPTSSAAYASSPRPLEVRHVAPPLGA
jgi:hypothetical protein